LVFANKTFTRFLYCEYGRPLNSIISTISFDNSKLEYEFLTVQNGPEEFLLSKSKKPTFEEIKFGHFMIKIGHYPKETRYAVFGVDKKSIKMGSEQSYEDAIAAAKAVVTDINKERAKGRVNGIPTAEEFAEALSQVSPTDSQWMMLKAHYRAPDRKLSSKQLSEAAGFTDLGVANMQYGSLGRKLADWLNYTPLGKYKDGTPLWITVLTVESSESTDYETGHYEHILLDEVATALELLGAC
jgi:hypothetical protein